MSGREQKHGGGEKLRGGRPESDFEAFGDDEEVIGDLLGGGVGKGLCFLLGGEASRGEGQGGEDRCGSGMGANHGRGQEKTYFQSLKRVSQAPVKTRLRLDESSFADFA